MRAFQRTILAATLLGAAFGATCADVKMYGTYDAGLVYQNFRHSDRSDLTMANGQTGMDNSLFGLQGREELGNGLYAGFQLEGGFNPDDGTMNASNTLFDRKARLFIGNETFEMTAGRFGNFTQAMTPYSVYGKLRANMSLTSMPGFAPANITWNGTFLSNAVAVRTNAKTGFFAQALYSNGDTGEEQYGWSDRRKVGQLAAGWTGEQLRFGSVLTYETQTRYSAEGKPSHAKRDATVGLHLSRAMISAARPFPPFSTTAKTIGASDPPPTSAIRTCWAANGWRPTTGAPKASRPTRFSSRASIPWERTPWRPRSER